jgi:sirohydrochlorin ferrochelatase
MRTARLAVVLVAHGSRDPRAARATEALARAVGAARPAWQVRASYLDHSVPRPRQVLADFAARGHRGAIVVPLLLTAAYHGRVDVPGEIAAARAEGLAMPVELAEVLGPTGGQVPGLLLDALEARLAQVSLPAALGAAPLPVSGRAVPARAGLDAVVLAAAGTRDAGARLTVEQAAAALEARLGVPCRVAYASAAPPLSGAVVTQLRAEGYERVGLASYFLAPGLLHDATVASARAAGVVAVADPLTDTPALAGLVAHRVLTAILGPVSYAA